MKQLTGEEFARTYLRGVIPTAAREMEVEFSQDYSPKESEYYREDMDSVEIYMFDVASGSWGWRQPEAILEYFDIEYAMDEENCMIRLDGEWMDYSETWETVIEPYASDVCDALKDMMKEHKPELGGHFYFGHLEADSAYGLFYYKSVEVQD